MARNLKTVSQFAATSAFTEPQLRWWIFHSNENGMAASGAVVRVGRRVYLDTDGFDRWLVAQNPGLQPAERNAQAGAR
jgi:hypothetical protein